MRLYHPRTGIPKLLPKLVKRIHALCQKNKVTLCTAESCTGGALSAHIISYPGASTFFQGSIVAYSDLAKIRLLNIPPNFLLKYGTMSPETAACMLQNALKLMQSDLGIAITGHAGSALTKEKIKKTIYIAIGNQKGIIKVFSLSTSGSRKEIIQQSVYYALLKIYEHFFELIKKEKNHC